MRSCDAQILIMTSKLPRTRSLSLRGEIQVLSACNSGFIFQWNNPQLRETPETTRVYILPQVNASIYPGHDWLRVVPGNVPDQWIASARNLVGYAIAACLTAEVPDSLDVTVNCLDSRLLDVCVHRKMAPSNALQSFDLLWDTMEGKGNQLLRREVISPNQNPVQRIRTTVQDLASQFS